MPGGRQNQGEHDLRRDRLITIQAFGLTDAEAEAMFDRVADAAHDLDEEVTCSMGPADEAS